MKRKELEAMGLEKEQVDQIMTQNGADIEAAKKELQDQVTTLTTEKEELQGQLNTANETLKGFKDVDVNDLREQIDKLTNDLDQAKKDADARVADLTFQQTLKDAIVAAKGRSTKAIMAELDLDTLRSSKNQNEDIKAAIEACQKEHDFLFESSEPIKNPVGGTDGDPAPSGDEATTAAMRAVMGLPSVSKGE